MRSHVAGPEGSSGVSHSICSNIEVALGSYISSFLTYLKLFDFVRSILIKVYLRGGSCFICLDIYVIRGSYINGFMRV